EDLLLCCCWIRHCRWAHAVYGAGFRRRHCSATNHLVQPRGLRVQPRRSGARCPGGRLPDPFCYVNQLPALDGQGISMALVNLDPCAINLPHIHPRATEVNEPSA
ncbi:unnamed protein product, partial [Ectocarpus sp. 12 AP-2014]